MNGIFPPIANTKVRFPSTLPNPDKFQGLQTTNVETNLQKTQATKTIRAHMKRKRSSAMRQYQNIAKPRDFRYAQRVHGSALAPDWQEIWTDDTSITSDPRAIQMDRDIRSAVTNALKKNIKTVLENSTIDEVTLAAKEIGNEDADDEVRKKLKIDTAFVKQVQKSVRELIPKDTPSSRLSNAILSQEQVAIARMRAFVQSRLRRQCMSSYKLRIVSDILDSRRYGHDDNVLARSLRRDDLVYSSFGHLVGSLWAVARHRKGNRGVGIIQFREMQREVEIALQDMVVFLANVEHHIVPDTIGQPDGKTLYTLNGEPIILVANGGAQLYYPKQNVQAGDTIQLKVGEQASSEGSEGVESSSSSASQSPTASPQRITAGSRAPQSLALGLGSGI